MRINIQSVKLATRIELTETPSLEAQAAILRVFPGAAIDTGFFGGGASILIEHEQSRDGADPIRAAIAGILNVQAA